MSDESCISAGANFFGRRVTFTTALQTCVLGLFLIVMSGLATADQKSNPNPCNLTEAETSGFSGDLSTDVHAVSEYTATAAQMLKAEEFEALDCVADHARSSKEKFSGGMWKIHVLYAGLSEPIQYPVKHATQEDWNNFLKRLQNWRTARPKSITAPVAQARAYISYAFDARGEGSANTVSESGWKLFAERIAEAKRILDEAATLPERCPEWYVEMLFVAKDQSWDPAHARALFAEADKFEPGYYYYARIMASYLLPRWSGSEGDTEKFMQEIADRVGGDQGDILYFQVASVDTVICGCDNNPNLSLERIARGFEASEKRYGVSMLNLNRMAHLAIQYGKTDPILANKIFPRISEQWDEETWTTRENFDSSRKWAAHMAPFAVKLHELEAAAAANMKKPQGPLYQVAFEKAYRGLVMECVRTDGSGVDTWEGTFETLTKVGATGTVEDSNIYTGGPVVLCLFNKLRTLQQQKATPFPLPPNDSYWVRLELDWASFSPVATK